MSKYEVARRTLPDGWFRSPTTGRRRPNGDESREYISW